VGDAEVAEARSQRTVRLQRMGALLIVVLVTVLALTFRDRLVQYERYGYLGVFLTTLAGSATVVLPVPGLAVVYLAGSLWNPLVVGLVAGFGDAVGESTGYLAGYAGQGLVEDLGLYKRFESWMRRNGFLTIFFLSAIPNPVFDLAGLAAGASGFSGKWFFLATWIGKTVKDVFVAVAGFYSIPIFANSILPGLSSLLQ
jgi:uncharacterized membrane protein YdjX (TVP38/TMEM64 family)